MLSPNFGIAEYATLRDTGSNTAAIAVVNPDGSSIGSSSGGGLSTNDGTFAKETGGNLASLVAKDFATSAKQDTQSTTLTTIKNNTNNLDVASSTLAKETGGNLASIAANTANIPASPATAGNQTSANTALGTVSDTAWTSGNGSIIALLKGIFGKLAGTLTIAGTVTANLISAIKDSYGADTAFTITLASLANSAVGVGRQSTLVDNTTNKFQSALIYLSIKVGTSPTANTPIYVYLIRSNNDDPIIDDGGGASDAGITINNAPLLGVINVPATTTGAVYAQSFDTSPLGPLGPKWAIAVVNNSGVALDATEGNHLKKFIGVSRAVS